WRARASVHPHNSATPLHAGSATHTGCAPPGDWRPVIRRSSVAGPGSEPPHPPGGSHEPVPHGGRLPVRASAFHPPPVLSTFRRSWRKTAVHHNTEEMIMSLVRRIGALGATVALVLVPVVAEGAPGRPGEPRYQPGEPGAGDPYFPLAGNGGIDVVHYDLDLDYTPPAP